MDVEKLLQDYRLAEAYDYPRGEVTAEGFARYLGSLSLVEESPVDLDPEITNVKVREDGTMKRLF